MANDLVRAGTVDDLRAAQTTVVHVGGVPVVVVALDESFHALDNRCPHMGFPLHQGDVRDGLLACHWHHARFDVTCGATLDPWADDADSYRVVVEDGEVFVDPTRPEVDPREHGLERLARGLQDNIALVTAKAVVEMAEGQAGDTLAVGAGALHGATQRADGWQPGLSILAGMANVLPALEPVDRQRALFHALRHIAGDTFGRAPRHPLPPLEGSGRDRAGLRTWLRETVEVRDRDGADRVLRTLVVEHGADAALDAVLAACTDHRYSDIGHTLDYALKCAELAEHLQGASAAMVPLLFTSLAPQLVQMQRMEETSAWRQPVDVALLVERAAADVPPAAFDHYPGDHAALAEETGLVDLMLAEDPAATLERIVALLTEGASPVALADAVVLAAVRRVLHFGKANETPDWDTVHHTLTYANAVAEGMRRVPSPELFRGVLDGAMSVYLDRFLNVPPARLPGPIADAETETLPRDLLALYDRRSAVDEAAAVAWTFLDRGGDPLRLLATLGHAVLREDAGFHSYQQLDIAWRILARRGGGEGQPGRLALTATARWLAAQFPTRRAREQTFGIARRLHRGDSLFAATE